jgi:hypothetical protein
LTKAIESDPFALFALICSYDPFALITDEVIFGKFKET